MKSDSSSEHKACYVCSSEKFVDDHHYDCREGKLSLETVPLCRRCHRTYHNLGVDWFEDNFLDKAIEIENRRRQLWKPPLQLMTRDDVRRSDYFNKVHGVTAKNKKQKKHVEEEGEQLALLGL